MRPHDSAPKNPQNAMPSATPSTEIADAHLPLVAGIDVGGTNIKIGLVDQAGARLAYTKIDTQQSQGPHDAARRTAAAVDGLLEQLGVAKSKVARAGLATPGPMDLQRGLLLRPGNLPAWHNSPVQQLFSEAVGLPVTYANDANAAAFGEFWVGGGADVDNMMLVTLGTGIGSGVIIEGKLLVGAHGAGGELGHIVIDCRPDAVPNSLRLRGTLEGECGSYGVVRRAKEALERPGASSSLDDEAVAAITPLAVAQAAEAGDQLALGVVMDTARLLAAGLASGIHTVDPERVLIGGAMTFGGAGHPLGEQFLATLRSETAARIFESLRDKIDIHFARLGGDAGYIGAAGLAQQDSAGG